MGTFSDNPRKRFVGLRFTEAEFEQIEAQMRKSDYIAISKFIRDRALNKQIKVRKNIILTDRNLRNMINDITTRIAKIGVDYNQATKQLNALSKKTRADGSPVINARAANYYLAKVATMTKELKEQNILNKGEVLTSTEFNKNYFTQIDIRDDQVFPLYAKHAKLLTTHPAGSYEFAKDEEKLLTLNVLDAEAFWSVSRYMVIQVR